MLVAARRVLHLLRLSLRFTPFTCRALEVQEERLRALRLVSAPLSGWEEGASSPGSQTGALEPVDKSV